MSDKIALNPGSIFAEINARISSAKYSSESESPNFVRRSSIQDIMAKSAEELTFQFSELVEKSEKELETKFSRGSNWSRIVEIEKIRELFEQISGEKPADLVERAKALLEKMSSKTDPYDAVRQMESDPTMQYLILREAQQQVARDPLLSRDIQTAIDLVQDSHPGASRHIKADMASAPAAAAMTPDRRLRALVRDSYRTAIVAVDSAAEMALHLLERYQESEVPTVIKTLARAASDDLRSPLVSCQPSKLEAVLKDLKSLQLINTSLSMVSKTLASAKRQGATIKRSVVRVATDLIRLAHLNPSERFVTDVMLGHIDGEKSVKLAYLSSCRQVFNAFPSTIWPDEDHKDRWIDCIGAYLDKEDPRELKAV